MARNEQRRQKKLEAKKSKRKEEQRMVARVQSSGTRGQMEVARNWPVVQARVSAGLWDHGMGEALLVRRGPGGITAYVVFLLDVYCLGVKNVVARAEPDHVAARWLTSLFERTGPWVDVSPEHVRKLVEGSIGYAMSLGLAPHHECAGALLIFGDLDSSRCSTEFTFGRDGKPLFIAGPHDNEARIYEILTTLKRTIGAEQMDYVLPSATGKVSGELADLLEETGVRVIDADELDSEVDSPECESVKQLAHQD
ncbi:MAG: hypothetical protein ACKV2Q_04750 [Planctomycetaceae bacterium]